MARTDAAKAIEAQLLERALAKIQTETPPETSPVLNNNEEVVPPKVTTRTSDNITQLTQDNQHEDVDNLDPFRKVAKQLGWVDKSEWTRDPEAWEDADKFFEKIPTKLKTLEDEAKRTAQAAAEALEETHRRARAEAEAEMLAAIEAGNKELAQAALKKLNRSDDAAQVAKWQKNNTWFTSNDPKWLAAIGLAKEISNREAQKGMDTKTQLERAEQAVKRQFPKLFSRNTDEVKLSEIKVESKQPPVVQGGNRNNSPNPKPASLWSTLRPNERQNLSSLAQKLSKKYKMPIEEAQETLAKSYQKPKGN